MSVVIRDGKILYEGDDPYTWIEQESQREKRRGPGIRRLAKRIGQVVGWEIAEIARNPSIRFRMKLCWWDFWVGIFWDRKSHALYICPVPMLVLKFWRE